MGMAVYFYWGGGRCPVGGLDWYSQAFEHGYSGHLTGWQWQTLFIEAYLASESPELERPYRRRSSLNGCTLSS